MMEILLVEDNPGDVRLTEEILKESRVKNHLHVASDGEEALDFLHKKGKYADVPRPDFILLDLNLPKKSGHEVLSKIKAHRVLKRIPVAILSSSSTKEDVVKSYNLHANCYIKKPIGIAQFMAAMSALEDFWFSIVQLSPE